jgi:FdhE protein
MNDTVPSGDAPGAGQVVERLEALVGREGVSDDYVRLRVGVLRAQADALGRLADSSVSKSAPLQEQSTALSADVIRFDPPIAVWLLDRIARAFREHGNPGEGLARLESAVGGDPPLGEELMRRAAFGPDEAYLVSLAERLEAPPELLLFVGRLLAAPFVTWAARRLEGQQLAAFETDGPCPACGSTAGLASLRPDDGGRVLHCSLCGHAWRFGRVACPFCPGRQQAGLSRLAVAGDDARWIEACDACGHYLKVVDRRCACASDPFIPLVEEVATLALDLVAEKEGSLRKPPYAAVR